MKFFQRLDRPSRTRRASNIRPKSVLSIVIAATISTLACSPSAAPPVATEPLLAITHVDVLPMSEEVILRDQTVVIRGNRIESLGDSSQISVPADAQTIDGTGKVLIPGLVDMHVHVDHPSELWIYPAYGVTSVLNLRGLPKHLDWREQIAQGRSMRPTLWTAGDYVDGHPPYMQPMMSFDSAEDAAAAVRQQAAAGYDVIKVYSRLSADQFEAIGQAARGAGIAVVGHGSQNYSLQELTAWQANVAHGEELIRWYWDSERPEESLEEIVQTLKSSKTSVTANLNFSRSLIRQHQDLESLLALPEARYLHPAILQPFRRESNRYARRDDAWLGRVRSGFELQKKLIKRLVDEGVIVLAGTDASTAGVYPGYSLAEELQEMVSAGLTPWQALRSATSHAGGFLASIKPDGDVRIGRVEAGYQADLVLLERNPLEDIADVSSVAGIVLRGDWHPKARLDARLAELDRSFEGLRTSVRRLEQMIFTGRIEEARQLFDNVRRERPGAVLFSQYVPFFVGYRYLYGEDGYHPDLRQREVALGLYRLYAETYPEFHSAHYLLALAYEANGDVVAARAAARTALALHPHHPDARELTARLNASTEP